MAKEDNKLRIVDLEDLQSETFSEKHISKIEEELVDPRVSIEELDRVKRTPPVRKVSGAVKQGELAPDRRIQNVRNRSKESSLNFLTNKFSFDKKRWRHSTFFLAAVVFAAGYFFEPMRFDDPVTIDDMGKIVFEAVFGVLFLAHSLFDKIYPFICLVVLIVLPLKVSTETMIQIFYEGVTVPSEIFSIGKPARRRLLWKDIKAVNFKSRYGTPYVQLIDKNGAVRGEMRLDVDRPKEMFAVLDTYAPEDHPLRKLLSDKKQPEKKS